MLARDRSSLTKIVFFYSSFIIYGSLVPLQFNQLSFSAAIVALQQVKTLDLSITNKSDWFTNFLLFMPLAYLLFCIIPRSKNHIFRALQLVSICGLLLFISVGIEFTQLFISQRVASFKDVFAQFLGIILSYVIYLITRSKFIRTFNKLNHSYRPNKWQSYANVTLAVFIFYSLMPLDLSISPVEIYKKWQAGKVNILPFSHASLQLNEWLFGIISDFGIWVLISWLYIKSDKYDARKIIKICLSFAISIELMQLFVLSRYSDITDIICALLGIVVAMQVFRYTRQNLTDNNSTSEVVSLKSILFSTEAIFTYWCGFLLFLAIYPLELVSTQAQLYEKWQMFLSVPLETYWREAPLQAVTQLLRKILLPIPLGLLIISLCLKYKFKLHTVLLAHVALVIYVFFLELSQLFLLDKIAVLSDSLLNMLGLFIGQYIFLKHTGKTHPLNNLFTFRRSLVKIYTPAIVVTIFFLVKSIPTYENTPYNIKELFDEHALWLSTGLIMVTFVMTFSLPPFLVNALQNLRKLTFYYLILATVLHTLLVFNLVYITFPNESLYDIVGYPTWQNWPHYIELTYRFFGLYLPISSLFFLIYCWLIKTNSMELKSTRFIFTLTYLFVVLPLAFIIVVVQAGTDNIVELLPNDGYSLNLLLLSAYLFGLVYISAWWVEVARNTKLRPKLIALLVTGLSAPIGYYFVMQGLQNMIIKYGQVFSSMQFILSPSRKELLSEQQVYWRFIAVHFGILFTLYLSGLFARVNKKEHLDIDLRNRFDRAN